VLEILAHRLRAVGLNTPAPQLPPSRPSGNGVHRTAQPEEAPPGARAGAPERKVLQ
jgi:hypothetical protein